MGGLSALAVGDSALQGQTSRSWHAVNRSYE